MENSTPVSQEDLAEISALYKSLDGQPPKQSIAKPRPLDGLLPSNIFIGFLSDGKKKDALAYVKSIIVRNIDAETAFYQFIPWRGGFLYEIHEGGEGTGTLNSILKYWDENNQNEVILPTGNPERNLKVIQGINSVSSLLLPEGDDSGLTEEMYFLDKMKPAFSDGVDFTKWLFGYMIVGVVCAIGFTTANVLIGQDFAYVPPMVNSKSLPDTQIRSISAYSRVERSYAHQVSFDGKKWKFERRDRNNKQSEPLDESEAIKSVVPNVKSMASVNMKDVSPVVTMNGNINRVKRVIIDETTRVKRVNVGGLEVKSSKVKIMKTTTIPSKFSLIREKVKAVKKEVIMPEKEVMVIGFIEALKYD